VQELGREDGGELATLWGSVEQCVPEEAQFKEIKVFSPHRFLAGVAQGLVDVYLQIVRTCGCHIRVALAQKAQNGFEILGRATEAEGVSPILRCVGQGVKLAEVFLQ